MLSRQAIYAFVFLVVGRPMLFADSIYSQSIHDVVISVRFEHATIEEALRQIEQLTVFKFAYGKDLKQLDRRINESFTSKTVAEVLQSISTQARINFRQVDKIISAKHVPKKTISSINWFSDTIGRPLKRIITGKVTDENGNRLIGATVQVKGMKQGTITDAEGNYRLTVPDDEKTIILVSYIGYEAEEIRVGNRSVIDIVMLPSIASLMGVEVVSTSYYEVEQRLNPGNIAKVDAKIIEQQPISNPLQALQGRVAGVYITQASGVPGSAFEIQIRGLNSLREDGNDPLYLINDVPYPSQSISFNQSDAIDGAINPLNFINPNDIESIEILKDADATAIYGSRGANGVIRITTRRGRSNQFSVTYNGSMGAGRLPKKLDVLNKEQYLMMRNEAFTNDGTVPGVTDFDVNGTWSRDRETDWQDEFLGGSSSFMNHQLSFSGGAMNTTFLFGVNYLRETTLFADDLFDTKISGNINLNHKSRDGRFDLNIQGNFTINNNDIISPNLAAEAITLAPHAPALYNEDGSLNWEGGTFNNPISDFLRESDTRTVNWVGNLQLTYELIQGLRLKSTFGFNELQTEDVSILPLAAINPFLENATGRANFGNSSTNTWLIEPQIEYRKSFNKNEIIVLGGTTFQETVTDAQEISATGYTNDALIRNPLAAELIEISNIDNNEYRFNSVYARINYMYNEKYIVNLTGRRDGSSRFGPGRQFANFGAIGLAWIFSEEDFTDNLSFLSNGKLRGSYGLTGSDQIGNYQFLELWEPTDRGYDGVQGLNPVNLFNPDFAWEETTKAEIGLELSFLENRLGISTSYFRNSSSNQLIGQPLPGSTGFGTVQTNFPAKVENRGWEIVVNTINLQKGDFKWSSSFNISIIRNELVSFPDIEKTAFANTNVVGKPLSIRFQRIFTGVDPESGLPTFQNIDQDDRVTFEDRLPIFNPDPDFFGGFQNTFSYKGITLDFHFRFVRQDGNALTNSFNTPGVFSNQPVQVLNRWQHPGDITATPRFTQTGVARAAYDNFLGSNQVIVDASFIRLQNARLSYQFEPALLDRFSIENLQLYLQGQNLLTFTGYEGWDPDTQTQRLPPLRMITAGLSVTF